MKKIIENRRFEIFCISLAVLCLGICTYRAIATCITGDEAFTYMNYVYDNPFKVFNLLINKGAWANNHILNSFIISLLQYIFRIRYNVFLLRIPNLLFYVLYMFYAYRISKKYDSRRYLCFSILTLNYGLNEFFGLARGYGMCSALVLVGLYYLKDYFDNKKDKSAIIGFGFLVASAYANTISLLIIGTLMLIVFIELIRNKNLWNFIKKNIIAIIVLLIPLLLVIRYHFMVSADGLPLYGGNTGFFKDVLVSLFYYYGFINNTFIVTCIILTLLGIKLLSNIKEIKQPFIYGIFIYFILMIAMVKITDTLWLTGRVLLPTSVFVTVVLLELFKEIKFEKVSKIFEFTMVICLILLFLLNINVTKTRDWANDYKIRNIAYRAYEEKDNSDILKFNINDTARFYREKILIEYKYDIFEKND